MSRVCLCALSLLFSFQLHALAQVVGANGIAQPAETATHLEIAVPHYPYPPQPHVSAKNIELVTAGQRLSVKLLKTFPTHLLVLFEGSTPRPSDDEVVKKLGKLLMAGWKVSVAHAKDNCPTPYVDSPANLQAALSSNAGPACFPGNAVAQLQSFAGRRVLFLMGSDRDTEASYDISIRLIPSVYRIDGGVLKPLLGPVEQRFDDPSSGIQPQTMEGGAAYGLINELNLSQAVKDALNAADEFYDFLVMSSRPPAEPVTLTFRRMPGTSFKIDLYNEKNGQVDGEPVVQRAESGGRLKIARTQGR